MNDAVIDEEAKRADIDLKIAQTKKAIAEAEVLKEELKAKSQKKKKINWQEALKTIGAAILGFGGIVAAFTQHQIAQKDAQIAEIKIATANQQLEAKKQEIQKATEDLNKVSIRTTKAVKELHNAEEAKRSAENEKLEAEIALKQYQAELEKLTIKVKQEKPDLIKDRLVYIQFRGGLTRELINELRSDLKTQGFNNPGAERLAGEYRSIVKYFSDSESGPAEDLAESTEAFFAQKGCPLSIEVVPAKTKSGSTSPIELWLSHSCK